MMRLRARFDGKVLVPVDPVDLPRDRILDVQVSDEQPPAGSVEAILRAVNEGPHVDRETVDEMERAIEAARLPVEFKGGFDDLRE